MRDEHTTFGPTHTATSGNDIRGPIFVHDRGHMCPLFGRTELEEELILRLENTHRPHDAHTNGSARVTFSRFHSCPSVGDVQPLDSQIGPRWPHSDR